MRSHRDEKQTLEDPSFRDKEYYRGNINIHNEGNGLVTMQISHALMYKVGEERFNAAYKQVFGDHPRFQGGTGAFVSGDSSGYSEINEMKFDEASVQRFVDLLKTAGTPPRGLEGLMHTLYDKIVNLLGQ